MHRNLRRAGEPGVALVARVEQLRGVRLHVIVQGHCVVVLRLADVAAEGLRLVLLVVAGQGRLVDARTAADVAHEDRLLVVGLEVVGQHLGALEDLAAHVADVLVFGALAHVHVGVEVGQRQTFVAADVAGEYARRVHLSQLLQVAFGGDCVFRVRDTYVLEVNGYEYLSLGP